MEKKNDDSNKKIGEDSIVIKTDEIILKSPIYLTEEQNEEFGNTVKETLHGSGIDGAPITELPETEMTQQAKDDFQKGIEDGKVRFEAIEKKQASSSKTLGITNKLTKTKLPDPIDTSKDPVVSKDVRETAERLNKIITGGRGLLTKNDVLDIISRQPQFVLCEEIFEKDGYYIKIMDNTSEMRIGKYKYAK